MGDKMVLLVNDYKVKSIYINLSAHIIESYEAINSQSKINIAKEDVLKSFDYYFTALILSIVLKNRSLEAGEINFINNLTHYSDYFKDIKIDPDEVPSIELSNYIKSESNRIIRRTPDFAGLCVMIDNRLEKVANKDGETFSAFIYKEFLELVNYLKEDDDKDNYLYSLSNFFVERKVYFK